MKKILMILLLSPMFTNAACMADKTVYRMRYKIHYDLFIPYYKQTPDEVGYGRIIIDYTDTFYVKGEYRDLLNIKVNDVEITKESLLALKEGIHFILFNNGYRLRKDTRKIFNKTK